MVIQWGIGVFDEEWRFFLWVMGMGTVGEWEMVNGRGKFKSFISKYNRMFHISLNTYTGS